MGLFFVVLGKALHQAEGMLTRRYSRTHGSGGLFFNGVVCLFATVFFLLTDGEGFFFPAGVWGYGALSAVMVALGFYSNYRALRLGSFLLTSMITGFSGVMVLLYAFLYLREPADAIRIVAIVLSVASGVVINLGKKEEKTKKVSGQWLLWTLVCLLSNGGIGILNRQQQIVFDSRCDHEFMIVSFGGAFLLLVLLAYLREREQLCRVAKTGLLYGCAIGLINGGKNLFQLISYRYLPLSVISPVGRGISLIFGFGISAFVYKEKLSKQQLCGTLLGVAALLLMALK